MQYSLNSALRVLIVLALALPGALLAQNYPTCLLYTSPSPRD